MTNWLISLPHDLKLLYEAASDENLDRKDRELAVGAIIYTVSPNDAVSADRGDFLGFCDDVILLRLALTQILSSSGDDAEFFRSRFAEFFSSLNEELAICREVMGDLFPWLEEKVGQLRSLAYKGKTVGDYLDDDEASEFLYEDGLGFATEYPVDEETLSDRLKRASTILEGIQRRRAEASRKGA
jgi:uncharacterized membrane protein YkvA (DUF1232 family)